MIQLSLSLSGAITAELSPRPPKFTIIPAVAIITPFSPKSSRLYSLDTIGRVKRAISLPIILPETNMDTDLSIVFTLIFSNKFILMNNIYC